MIANDDVIGGSQQQLPAKRIELFKELTPVRFRVQKLRSFSIQSVNGTSIQEIQSVTDPFGNKLAKKLLKDVKIYNIVHIFIQKLKQNACIVQNKPIRNIKKRQQFILHWVLEIFYHLTIVFYYLGIICLLLLSSWNASLISFHQENTLSWEVFGLKILSLLALVIQAFVGVWSRFFKNEEGIKFSIQNLRKDILSFSFLTKIIQVILCIFFIIFPESMILSGILFVFQALILIFGGNEVSHLQAAYIHTKKRNFRWKIIQIFFLNILIIHIVAIVLILLTFLNEQNNWFIKNELNNQKWQDQYIAGYYWSTVILTTIGFGDISGTNSSQRMIVALLALFACALLAFNINTFSNIFGLLKESIDNVENKIVMFRRMVRRDYRNNVSINPALKKRIYQYIDSLLEERRDLEYIEKNQFLANIPQKLKKDYYKDVNKSLFSNIVFLNSLCNETLQALSQKFSIQFLKQGQILEPNDLQIRILQQGSIDFTYSREGSTTSLGRAYDNLTVKKRQKIALINSDFLSFEKQSNFGMRSKQFSVTWYMTIDDFLDILKNDIRDFQYYFNILHRHSYDVNECGTFDCPRCHFKDKRLKHTAFKCPNLTYVPFNSFKILKYLSTPQINQKRLKLRRKKDAAPRTSVLKYWKKYLKKNFELERKRDQQSHMKNIIKTSNKRSSFNLFSNNSANKSYQNYYAGLQRYQIIENQHYLQIQVDAPFNFQFYMPYWNPCRLIFTEVEGCLDLGESSIIGTLKNIRYMIGQKFDYSQMQEIAEANRFLEY